MLFYIFSNFAINNIIISKKNLPLYNLLKKFFFKEIRLEQISSYPSFYLYLVGFYPNESN